MDRMQEAHRHSIRHREEILASTLCGCFCCCKIFFSTEIDDWCDSQWHPDGATALCPKCGIDSVIGDKCGHPITAEFLQQMRQRWF